jgi:hypothetical protein
VIPVTASSGEVELPVGIDTLLLPDGSTVTLFVPYSGFSAIFTPETLSSIPGLPGGMIFHNSTTLSLFLDGEPIGEMPDGVTLTYAFPVPAGVDLGSLNVLFWDENLNDGLGGWTPVDFEIVDGFVVFNASLAGTYALVSE